MTRRNWLSLAFSVGALAGLLIAGPQEAAAQNPTAGTNITGKPVYLRKLSVLRYTDSFVGRIYTLTRVTLQVDGRGVCTDGWCPLTHNNVALFARRSHVDMTVPQGSIVVSERTLRRGDNGDDVKALQDVLIKKGYNLGIKGADGVYGTATVAAVRDFQKKNGLIVDGEVGAATRKRLVG